MDLAKDPGGVFVSDLHRRVLAALPTPANVHGESALHANDLPARLKQCELPLTWPQAAAVLNELIESGDAELIEGELYRQTPGGHEKLTGPIADEPPPKEGADLQRAEKVNKEVAKADEKLIREAKEQRKAELQEELAALEEEN